MDRSIILAADVEADRSRVFEALSTTNGQRAFWTPDCDMSADHARFGFPQAPMDLLTDVITEPGKLVRMRVTSGFPFWKGSTWEWELCEPARGSDRLAKPGSSGGYHSAPCPAPGASWQSNRGRS